MSEQSESYRQGGVETVVGQGFGLIEGPTWISNRGLAFSDVLFGGIYLLDNEGGVEVLFEHRKGVGGMALHASGGLVVSGRNIGYKGFNGGATITLLERDEAAGLVGFNDLTTDARGRIYAGGLGSSPVFADGREPASQNLYLIDLEGGVRVVGEDIQLTNGLGFSPDGRTLYHSDSRRRSVYCYAVADDGGLGAKTVFAECERGVPDGLVVSEDGAVWVALAGGGQGVAIYSADGTFLEHIEIPHPMCTSVCFGGTDRRDLYIVSGSDGLEGDRSGGIFKVRTQVAGLPVADAKVRIG